jgi:hypothetical protein
VQVRSEKITAAAWGHVSYQMRLIWLITYDSTCLGEQVRKDIINDLRLRSPKVLVSSFNRPNIHYTVRYVTEEGNPMHDIPNILGGASSCSLIYVLKRETADQVAAYLRKQGGPHRLHTCHFPQSPSVS